MDPPLYSGIRWRGLKQWVKPGESVLKRPRTQHSAGKVMASVFWDTHGVIFIDYLEKRRKTTGAYYAALLDRLVDHIRQKRQHLKKKQTLFHYYNAPSHTSSIAQAKKHELGFELPPHPPYSQDKKRWLYGRRFESNEEVELETEGYVGGLVKSYYLEGIEKLKDRWIRCIELQGEYIEK